MSGERRIVMICGPSHRDDGPPLYFERALNLVPGVTCVREPVTQAPSVGPDDWALYVDWGQDCFPHLPSPTFPPRTLCVQSDTHWTEASYVYRMAQAFHARIAFMNQANVVPELQAKGHPRVYWTPHAADHTVYTPPLRSYANIEARRAWEPLPEVIRPFTIGRAPRYDIVFVGHLGDPGRVSLLDRLFKAPLDVHLESSVFFESTADLFHEARIVLNHSVRGELNMRTFEALASRSFMLTDYQLGMEELGLKDGVHCAIYRTPEEAIDKARYYASRDGMRERIAEEGWQWCLRLHTYWHRARFILARMNEHHALEEASALVV